MKKQWIIIIVLAALLLTAVIIASRSFPDVNDTPSPNNKDTTQTTGSEIESTDPTDENFENTLSTEDNENTFPTVSYEEYQFVMSDPERQAYADKFPSNEAFYAWFYSAKDEYEAKKENDPTPTISGDGTIDIGGFIDSNNG